MRLPFFFRYTLGKEPNVVSTNKERLPNIIYVLADDLGYGDIATFNPAGKILTPAIDKLASEGMKFTDAHTSSSVCTPTRYGIMTGRDNWRSSLKQGVPTGVSKALVPNSRTSVASLLKRAGYHSAFVGKWHLGWDWALKEGDSVGGTGWNPTDYGNIDFAKPVSNGPNSLGFDYSFAHAGSLDMAPYVYVENGIPTSIPDTVTVNTAKYSWWREGPTGHDFKHDRVTPDFFERSFTYIEERSAYEQPFFLFLALPSPHTPILPTAEWQGRSGLNPYADFVMQIDDYIGQLTKILEEEGIAENTLVIFTSDKGCSPEADFDILGAKGHQPSAIYRGHKADIYEGGHRVPFIVRWPDKIKPATESHRTICSTDLLATCADLTGISLKDNEGEDSFSLLPLFMNTDSSEYTRDATVHHSIKGNFAIRKENWKLVFCPGSGGWSDPKPGSDGIGDLPKFQLFNLETDPGEQINLYRSHPEIVIALKQLMISYIEKGRSTKGLNQENEPEAFGSKDWKQVLVFEDLLSK